MTLFICSSDLGAGCGKYRTVDSEGNVSSWTNERPKFDDYPAPARTILCLDCLNQMKAQEAKVYLGLE